MPDLELVPLVFNSVIYKWNAPIEYVYFPDSGVISMLAVIGEDTRVEVGLTGREGLPGIPVVLGVAQSSNQIIVRAAGAAMRIRVEPPVSDFAPGCAFHYATLL